MQFSFVCVFLTLLLLSSSSFSMNENGKMTSQDCMACHQTETVHWQTSDHAMAMALPDSTKVVGNFNQQQAEHYSQKALFFTDGDLYKATISDTDTEQSETFTIKYTFGHYPLQQYLVETKAGTYHVLPFAWDARLASEGGQRWYHNYSHEEIASADRLHWRQPLQNWNGMCADCHSDELTRNYAPLSDSFDTQYSGINVGCVSCHGVMDNHQTDKVVNQSATNVDTLSVNSSDAMPHNQALNGQWTMVDKANTAIWKGAERNNDFMQTCYACHSLRAPLTDGFTANKPFLDQFSPNLITPPLYYADGQIKEEVYVYGSFLQSKMYAKGVNCIDCHDAHSMKVKVQGNGLCLQCHKSTVFDTPKHHKHEAFSAGAQCVNCHMPDRVYMGVDNRRDHSFKIPRAQVSDEFDSPNACLDCHQEKTNKWADETLTKWYGKSKTLSENQRALLTLRHGQPISLNAHLAILADSQLSVIERASAIELLAQSTAVLSTNQLLPYLQHKEDLIRLAATRVAALLEVPQRVSAVSPLLNDPLKAVRSAAAQALVGLQIAQQDIAVYTQAFNELLVANEVSAWRGEGRINQGNIALQTNDLIGAETAYQASIEIDPYFPVGYMNLADLYRAKQREDMVENVLNQGLQNVPKSADVAYAYGLHQVRIKRIGKAIEYFKKAMTLNPANEQLAYTYALALDGNAQTAEALEQLKILIPRYDNQQSLIELGLYLARKANNQQDFNWFQTRAR